MKPQCCQHITTAILSTTVLQGGDPEQMNKTVPPSSETHLKGTSFLGMVAHGIYTRLNGNRAFKLDSLQVKHSRAGVLLGLSLSPVLYS